jgi:hypothetical protein
MAKVWTRIRQTIERQVAAIRLVLMSKVVPALRILAAKGINLLLCAPTGRAAKRMTEAIQRPSGRILLLEQAHS